MWIKRPIKLELSWHIHCIHSSLVFRLQFRFYFFSLNEKRKVSFSSYFNWFLRQMEMLRCKAWHGMRLTFQRISAYKYYCTLAPASGLFCVWNFNLLWTILSCCEQKQIASPRLPSPPLASPHLRMENTNWELGIVAQRSKTVIIYAQ